MTKKECDELAAVFKEGREKGELHIPPTFTGVQVIYCNILLTGAFRVIEGGLNV